MCLRPSTMAFQVWLHGKGRRREAMLAFKGKGEETLSLALSPGDTDRTVTRRMDGSENEGMRTRREES